jgi:hypothetical protein
MTASATTTVVQVAAGAKPLRVIEVGFSFDGVDATKTPVHCRIVRQTTTGTASALTLIKENEGSEAALATATSIFTAEPTNGDILRSWYVSPAGGLWVIQFPLGREPVVAAATGRIAVQIVTGAGVTANTSVYLTFEE